MHDAPSGFEPGKLITIRDPAHPLCGQSFPLVCVRKRGGQKTATVRLPAGDTRAVPLAATQPPTPELLAAAENPGADFRELWKRREWIRALARRLKERSGTDSKPEEDSDKDAATDGER